MIEIVNKIIMIIFKLNIFYFRIKYITILYRNCNLKFFNL